MKELDMRKKQCPIPVMEAKKALESPGCAGGLAVRVDNEIAVQNLCKLAKSQGMSANVQKSGEDDFTVEMTAAGEPEQVQIQEETAGRRLRTGMIAVIASDQMGEPDAVLGKVLMKGFLYALAGQDLLPKTVIFYNGGARLTTEESDSLEDLAQMAEQGVEILTCGTCLKHLGLEDKLKVGAVTNMYDIVERMASADLILRP